MNTIFDGTISVKSVMESGKREIIKILMDENKKSKDFGYIYSYSKNHGIKLEKVKREVLDKLTGHTRHGGVALIANPRKLPELDRLKSGFVCYIDGVEDPYNLGSITRTLYAAGCSQLLINERDWSKSENVILKSSAGAWEKMDIALIKKDEDLVLKTQEQKIPLICAFRKDATALTEYTYPQNFVLAIGGALRGLSSKLIKASSQNVYIKYGRDFKNALDSASAAAVFAFEYVRQKEGEHYEL